jgi:hypothetical protein
MRMVGKVYVHHIPHVILPVVYVTVLYVHQQLQLVTYVAVHLSVGLTHIRSIYQTNSKNTIPI